MPVASVVLAIVCGIPNILFAYENPALQRLLHGEAAYLHDGPEIKNLAVITGLNNLSSEELAQLRAFLYSL